MAKKPIIEIDIQDEKFQKFLKAYGEFEDSIKDIPSSWKRVDNAISGSGKRMSALSAKAAQSLGLSAKNAQKLDNALKAAAGQTKNLGDNAKKSSGGFDALRKSAEKTRKVIRGIWRLTKKLGKFSLGAIGLSGAGLWGLADLTGAATSRERESLAAGVSPGVMAAWKTSLWSLQNPGAILNKIATARQTASGQAALNIGAPGWQNMTVSQTAAKYLETSQAMMKRARGSHTALTQAEARLSLLDTPNLLALMNMKKGLLPSQLDLARRAAPSMQFDAGTAKKWADLQVALEQAGYKVSTALINALSKLAPKITQFSETMTNQLVKFIGSKEFSQDVDSFIKGIKLLAQETMTIAHYLSWILPSKGPKPRKGFSAAGFREFKHPLPVDNSISEMNNRMSKTLQMMQALGPIHVLVTNKSHADVSVMSHAATKSQ